MFLAVCSAILCLFDNSQSWKSSSSLAQLFYLIEYYRKYCRTITFASYDVWQTIFEGRLTRKKKVVTREGKDFDVRSH